MTELEELNIVKRFLGKVLCTEMAGETHRKVCMRIRELEKPTEDYKARAERAEAALAEAQNRFLWFERLLKAEEARKVDEPVLDRNKALKTSYDVLDNAQGAQSMMAFLAIRLYMESTGVAFDDVSPYKWK